MAEKSKFDEQVGREKNIDALETLGSFLAALTVVIFVVIAVGLMTGGIKISQADGYAKTANPTVAAKELPVVVRTVYIHGEAAGEYFRQVIEVTRIHPGNNDQERYRLYQLVPFLASSAKGSIWFVGDEAVLKIDPYGLPVELRKP